MTPKQGLYYLGEIALRYTSQLAKTEPQAAARIEAGLVEAQAAAMAVIDGVEAEREACAALMETGDFCRMVEHSQGMCECRERSAAIRARSL